MSKINHEKGLFKGKSINELKGDELKEYYAECQNEHEAEHRRNNPEQYHHETKAGMDAYYNQKDAVLYRKKLAAEELRKKRGF